MKPELFDQLETNYYQSHTFAKSAFDIPTLPKAQCIVIPVIRESIGSLLIRNNDSDMVTDIYLANQLRVRMIASKTKGVERRRGSQILRSLDLGGKAPTNKSYIPANTKASEVFDLNTFVFGDSANTSDSKICPVHSAVLYSDAISIQPSKLIIDDVFRQGGISDEFVSFDAETKKNSSNIFTTRSVLPNSLFIQSLVITGNRITRAALDHLLLSIGLTGAYGGATATTGTNLKTHFVGLYWGGFERAINAPSEMLQLIAEQQQANVTNIITDLNNAYCNNYPNHILTDELNAYIKNLIKNFEDNDKALIERYQQASQGVAKLFDKWFGYGNEKKSKAKAGNQS